jgi:hypothetical protein
MSNENKSLIEQVKEDAGIIKFNPVIKDPTLVAMLENIFTREAEIKKGHNKIRKN